MTRKDEELYNKVVALYDEGRTAQEILEATGLRSTGTLYRIINKLGIKGRRATGEFRVVISLPEELRQVVDEQEDFSKFVAKLLYSQFEGRFSKAKLPYSQTEGNSAYSHSEGVNWDPFHPVVDDGSKSHYSQTEGASPDPDGQNEDIADMRVLFYKDCATVRTTPICTYMDEALVKELVLTYSQTEGLADFDEVAVYCGAQLLWLWHPIRRDDGTTELAL